MTDLIVENYKPRHPDRMMKLYRLIPSRWVRVTELAKLARLKAGQTGWNVGLLVRRGLVERKKIYCPNLCAYESCCRRKETKP